MHIKLKNPPAAILASGSKDGVELGGQKCIISIDSAHNLYNEGNIYTEMSWGEFYKEEGLEDQVDTFSVVEFNSVRDDPEALAEKIVQSIDNIIKNNRVLYGVGDFECDAFMNQNTVIPGLKLDYKVINKLLEAHRKTRDENLFPSLITDTRGNKAIRIEFQGANKKNLHFYETKIENIAEKLRLSQGFATGIVCTSRGAANLYIMSDNIVFKADQITEMYIDQENIDVIMMAFQREMLTPISWFRIDIGIKSLDTFELWEKIKDKPILTDALKKYEEYITALVYKKYQAIASSEKIGVDLDDDFYNMDVQERNKALKDMADTIRKLTKIYKE